MNDLQISIKRRAANLDGRKDFRMKIVDGRLRMKWKIEDRYAVSREDLPDTVKSELSCSFVMEMMSILIVIRWVLVPLKHKNIVWTLKLMETLAS